MPLIKSPRQPFMSLPTKFLFTIATFKTIISDN